MFNKNISVVLPVYNEEGNIKEVISSVLTTISSIISDFEIIIVDDGSFDKTAKIIEEIKSKDSHVKVIRHRENQGYGAALTSGIRASEKELIFIMDADGQFDISEITKFIPYINDFDIVAGFRIKRRDSLYRYILGYGFNFVIKILFGIKLKDVDCGFKLYKSDIIKNIPLNTKGLFISTEIMALAYKNKARIKEIGVNHYPRVSGCSKIVSFKVILKTIFEALRFYIVEK